MTEQATSRANETETLRGMYAALNRGDVAAAITVFAPDVEWTEEFPGGGAYSGRAALEALMTRMRGNWAEGACEPERFIAAGDRIIVFAHVRVRLKDETEWREGRIADVHTFRNGKVVQTRVFGDRQQALDWAGVKASDVG